MKNGVVAKLERKVGAFAVPEMGEPAPALAEAHEESATDAEPRGIEAKPPKLPIEQPPKKKGGKSVIDVWNRALLSCISEKSC